MNGVAQEITIRMSGETLAIYQKIADMRGCGLKQAIKDAGSNEYWIRRSVPAGGTISIKDSTGVIKREKIYE